MLPTRVDVDNNVIRGPAIVEAADTTIVVNPGQRARVDHLGDLVIEMGSEREGVGTGGG